MSSGIIPPVYRCFECRWKLFGTDAIWYDGKVYHEHCIRFKLGGELAKAEERYRLGKLTAAETKEYTDKKDVLLKIRKEPATPSLQQEFYPDMPKFKGSTRLSTVSIRLLSAKANAERKALGMDQKEYMQKIFLPRREALEKQMHQLNQNKNYIDLLPAGEIKACKICRRMTFLIDGFCQDCFEQKNKEVSDILIA